MRDNLYLISQELATIHQEIEDAQGDLSEALEARLDAVSLNLKEKTENIVRWTLTIDSKTESIDKEIYRLQHRKEMAEKLNKRLQNYVKSCMERAEIKKLDYPLFTVVIQKNPPSVDIINEESIPNGYKTIKTTISVEKKRLLDDLKAGQSVEGCQLITDKTHLRIK